MHNFTMTVKQNKKNTNTSLLMQTKKATGNDYLSEKNYDLSFKLLDIL